jgi:hypothetical protein
MEVSTSILERIKKLLNLAALNSGATEEERLTAMRMASGLMAQHNLSRESLLGSKEEIKARYGKRNTQKLQEHHINLACAAGMLYGCKAVFWGAGKQGFAFIGRADNIEASEFTMMWLIQQVDHIYKTVGEAQYTAGDGDKWRRDFKRACSLRVLARAEDYIHNPQLLANTIGSTALVVKDYFQKLEVENKVVSDAAGVTEGNKNWGVRRTPTNRDATRAGYAAGDRVQLHQRVR